MSIPWTYPHHDWLMYILYTADAGFMAQIIRGAALGVQRAHASPAVHEALRAYEPSPSDSLLLLRAKLLVLLDQDEGTRQRLCEFQSEVPCGWRPVCKDKATRFYTALHDELLPAWVRDERVPLGEFVDRARMLYLVS